MSTIFRNHMTADGLWGKVTLLSAYLQTKTRRKWTCFDGEIESQTTVPPVSPLTCDLSSVLRVNRDTVEKIKLVFLVIFTIFSQGNKLEGDLGEIIALGRNNRPRGRNFALKGA